MPLTEPCREHRWVQSADTLKWLCAVCGFSPRRCGLCGAELKQGCACCGGEIVGPCLKPMTCDMVHVEPYASEIRFSDPASVKVSPEQMACLRGEHEASTEYLEVHGVKLDLCKNCRCLFAERP